MKAFTAFSLALLTTIPILGKAKAPQRWNAKQYAQSSSAQFNNAVKELHLLNLKGNESILDIGCGNGQLAAYILKRYLPKGTIHGIDFSAAQVKKAQELYANNPRLSFARGNVVSYTPTQQYDAVISFWVLHWVEQYEQALRTIYTALKPGGKALIGHLAEHDLALSQAAKKLLDQEPWKQYCKGHQFPIHSFPLEQISSAARAVGFKIEYQQFINETARFKNNKEYQAHYQVLPVAGCVPKEKQAEFFAQVMKTALPHEIHNSDGSITVNGYVIYMVLEKPKT